MSGPAIAPDTALVTHSTIKGIQTFALLTPPVLIAHSLLRRSPAPLSPPTKKIPTAHLSRFLRNNTLGTFVVGGTFGALLGWGKVGMIKQESEMVERVQRLGRNKGQRRVDDWSLIGAVLGSLVTTTVLLRRVPLVYAITGGAALGVAGGVAAHVFTPVEGVAEGL